MTAQGLAAVLAEVLCPPHHREGMVVSIVGQPTKFGPRRVCTYHGLQASNLAPTILAWLETVAGDAAVREAVAEVIDRRTGRHMGTASWQATADAAVAALLAAVRSS